MKSFGRYLLFCFVVHSAVCLIIPGLIRDLIPGVVYNFTTCDAYDYLNTFRCIIGPVNANYSSLNCIKDYVCIHGKKGGYCNDKNKCVCTDDVNITDVELDELRRRECTELITKNLLKTFEELLCTNNKALPLGCIGDCKCGHDASDGICRENGFTLDVKNYAICECIYSK